VFSAKGGFPDGVLASANRAADTDKARNWPARATAANLVEALSAEDIMKSSFDLGFLMD